MPPSELAASALSLAPVSGANRPPVSIEDRFPWISGAWSRAALTAIPLIVADLAAMAVSFTVAWSLTTWIWPQAAIEWNALAVALFSALFVAGAAVGIYPGVGLSAIGEIRLAATTAACIGPVFLGVSFLQHSRSLAMTFAIAATCLLLIPCLAWFRQALRQSFSRFRWWGQPAIVVGSEHAAQQVFAHLRRYPGIGLRPLGVVDDGASADASDHFSDRLGSVSRLTMIGRQFDRPWLVVARAQDFPVVERYLNSKVFDGVLVSRLDGPSSVWQRASGCLDWPGQGVGLGVSPRLRPYKRALDLAASIALIAPLTPLLLLISLLIKVSSPGPVIFRQQRVGFEGRRFQCWKFRTMVCDGQRVLEEYLDRNPQHRAEWERDHKLKHDPRVTTIGRLLRKTSLDELPQLWNVFCGQMSLVGPRPILASEIPDFGPEFAAFCSVLPGITGLWQVSGRNQTTYAEHVELDGFYARHWSLWLDLHILLKTVKVVLLRQGAC